MNNNELIHFGIKGMKWGKRKNYYGSSGDKYRASNGLTVGAPKNAGIAAFRKVQGSKVGGATLNGMAKINTAFYGRGKNKNTWKNFEKQIRKENEAVMEANKAHKKAVMEANKAHKKAINDAYKTIKKSQSVGSRMTYNNSVYKKAAKNMVDKGMDQKKAVSKAKMAAWRNYGMIVAGNILISNSDKIISGIQKYANQKAMQRANAGLARIGTMKLVKVAGNVYEYR